MDIITKVIGMHRIIATLLAMFAVSGLAASDTTRCGTKIVKVGMTTADVLRYCGEPNSKEVEEHVVHAGVQVTGTTQFHRWIYNRGSKGKPVVFEFDQDTLLSIKPLNK